jgi:serine/threonine protein phosphatase 1
MFRFRKTEPAPKPPGFAAATPAGSLIYVIGDIHGRADLLGRLIEILRTDSEEQAPQHRPILMFLGDYVDRGPTSRQVLDALIKLRSDPWFKVFALCGNHDQFFLDFLERPQLGATWMNYGGGATLSSYGVSPPRTTDEEGWGAAAAAFAEAVPASHLEFLKNTSLYSTFGDYIFAHAGVRPEVELAAQKMHDLTSIRGPFLASADPAPGHVVVFGHTPYETPLIHPHKIGVDTGACVTGVLTALAVKDGVRRFIQTGSPDRIWDLPPFGEEPAEPPRRL